MNRRQKKKLKKRDGHFHYKDYRWWQRVWELAAAKHGVEYVKAWRLEAANVKGFQRNMIYIVTSPFCWKCALKIATKFNNLDEQTKWDDDLSRQQIIKEIADNRREELYFSSECDRNIGMSIVDVQRNDVVPTKFHVTIDMSKEVREKFFNWVSEQYKDLHTFFMQTMRECKLPVVLPGQPKNPVDLIDLSSIWQPDRWIAFVTDIKFDSDPVCQNDRCVMNRSKTAMGDAIMRKDVLKEARVKPIMITNGNGDIVNVLGFILYLEDERNELSI